MCFKLMQVVKDLVTERGEAKITGNEAALERALATMQAYARRFLKRKAAVDKAPKAKKVQRTKSWQWCCAVDNAIQVGGGFSLSMLQIDQKELLCPRDPCKWPVASCVIDKGSD